MKTEYLCPVDAWIDRDVIGRPDIAQLRDNDGGICFDFPKDWTDEQIMKALAFANKTYEVGVRMGKREKARQMRLILEEP
jgi:hypothetical protein